MAANASLRPTPSFTEAGGRASPDKIRTLFTPRSIAVVGASSNAERFGGRIIPTLLRQGFAGAIYPVNAQRDEIAGVRCYPRLRDIPGDVDCVIYALVPEHLRSALEGARAHRVKLLVVASSGFGERGDEEGRRLDRELLDFAGGEGMRVLGPNCIGFANFVEKACANAAAMMNWPDIPVGGIGLVSQSGGLGLTSILHEALKAGIGFSHIVTTGNEVDIDTIDVARFLVADPDTHVVGITVEAVRDRRAFIELIEFARDAGKPLVVLKSGRTDIGRAMAASHTGALAGAAEVFEAVCRQYGVVATYDVDEFVEIAAMFGKLRAAGKLARPRSVARHVTAISISGGHIGLFADHASLNGLSFPEFTAETEQRIAGALGFEGNFQNPLDATARMVGDDAFWGRCLDVLLDTPTIEAVAPIITVSRSYERAAADIVARAASTDKVVLTLWSGGDFEGDALKTLQRSDVPLFRNAARATAALRALDDYLAAMERPIMASRALSAPSAALVAAARAGRASLTERESKDVLADVGVPVTRERSVETIEQAVAAAREIGLPVVLKGEHPGILHKSEAGLVFLNVASEADLVEAHAALIDRMTAAAGDMSGRVLVQEMAPSGVELILGVTSDPEFGLVVVFGLGGVFVEILNDVSMRLPPFDHAEALRMIDEIKGVAILKGARGRPKVDLDRLASLLVSLGDFAVANAEVLKEVDVNPLIVGPTGEMRAADALIVLKPQAAEIRHGA